MVFFSCLLFFLPLLVPVLSLSFCFGPETRRNKQDTTLTLCSLEGVSLLVPVAVRCLALYYQTVIPPPKKRELTENEYSKVT